MSVDGPGLFESDGSRDARSRYLELTGAGRSSRDAIATMVAEWRGLLNDPWENADFWIALAATQVETEVVDERVRAEALHLIDSGSEMARWEYSSEFVRARRPIIEDLRARLVKAPFGRAATASVGPKADVPEAGDTDDSPADPELLSLGLIGGGMTSANEPVHEALMKLMRHVKVQRGRYPNEGLRINIVFQIPGRFLSPDFEGVHPARFSRRTSHLLVNCAVPTSLAEGGVHEYFVQALSQTKAAAVAYLLKRKIAVDSRHVMALIDDVISTSREIPLDAGGPSV